MKLFLAVNFVFVFLILTASYVTDFILNLFNLMSPHSPNEITAATAIRVAYLSGITVAWLCYRYSWKKKYTASLDPNMQTAMNQGQGIGTRLGIVIALVSVAFVVWKYVLKM